MKERLAELLTTFIEQQQVHEEAIIIFLTLNPNDKWCMKLKTHMF